MDCAKKLFAFKCRISPYRKPFLNNNGICCFTLRKCRLSSFDRKLDGTWPSFKKEIAAFGISQHEFILSISVSES